MRSCALSILMAALLGLVAGCAQRSADVAMTTPPSHAELPDLSELERWMPAKIAIEHRGDQARVQLVPDFVDPEPTPEELAALGQRRELVKFLKYPLPGRDPHSRVGSWYGGVVAAGHGWGGASVDRSNVLPSVRAGHHEGVAIGTSTFGSRVAGVRPAHQGVSRVGHREEIVVETGPASKIAGRKSSVDQ